MDDAVDRAPAEPAQTPRQVALEGHRAGDDRMLKALFDQSAAGFAILDRDFKYVRVNAAFAQHLGAVVGRFPGSNYADAGGDCSDTLRVLTEVARTKKALRVAARPEFCALNETVANTDAPNRARDGRTRTIGARDRWQIWRSRTALSAGGDLCARGRRVYRTLLAQWVGSASARLSPLTDTLRAHVVAAVAADVVHADDTPIPVLAPGSGKTKTGRLWTYVRDERPAAGEVAPAVWFAYSADRKGEHPRVPQAKRKDVRYELARRV